MSSVGHWDTTFPRRAEDRATEQGRCSRTIRRLWCCLGDARNAPRYAVKYGVFVLAILGALELWAVKGDGPMPPFEPLSASANLDPHRVSSAQCMLKNTTDQNRWDGLAPALAILGDTNPEVAQWVEEVHQQQRLVFTDRFKDAGDTVNFLAKFDLFERRLLISPGLYAETDGSVAAILCHEYRHACQRLPKVLNYALSYLFLKGGNPAIVENDALIYEQEARCAIYGTSDEALEAYATRLAAAE
jgi:hypothetical protein